MLNLHLILLAAPLLFCLYSAATDILKDTKFCFQFGLPELLLLPLAAMPSTLAFAFHSEMGGIREGKSMIVTVLFFYQTIGGFMGRWWFRAKASRGGWDSAFGMLLGAYYALVVFAFWVVLTAMAMVLIFGRAFLL